MAMVRQKNETEKAKVKRADITWTGFMLCVLILLSTQSATAVEKYRVYFGTTGALEGSGIFSSVLDVKTGQLTEPKLAAEAMRPGVITINPAGTHLYSIGKPAGYKGAQSGLICAYKIDRKNGSLELLNFQESKGQGPCYLQVDHQGRNILVCHYMSGNCSVLPLAEDGSVEPASSVQQHTGSGKDPRRQNAPHPHSITLDSTGRYAFVTDLGLDQIVTYRFDPEGGRLLPGKPPYSATKSGGGPRHFVFDPSEKFAYVNLELTSEVTVFRYDPEHGSFDDVQTVSTLPNDFGGRNANAGIRITPDGRFLYVSNRGHNSIALFAVDPDTGTLTLLRSESVRGDVPHTIVMEPTGSYLVVTDMRSGRASVFRINKETGRLTYTGSTIDVPNVNTVVFQPLD